MRSDVVGSHGLIPRSIGRDEPYERAGFIEQECGTVRADCVRIRAVPAVYPNDLNGRYGRCLRNVRIVGLWHKRLLVRPRHRITPFHGLMIQKKPPTYNEVDERLLRNFYAIIGRA